MEKKVHLPRIMLLHSNRTACRDTFAAREECPFPANPIELLLSESEPETEARADSAVYQLEVEAYLKEKNIPTKSDPLEWWKLQTNYPNIKQLVARFLCPPPSSVESERVFSTLGGIYTVKRSRLSGEHARAQLLLHHHL